MEAFAITVLRIAKLNEWRALADEASTGKRSQDHESRRHIRHMPTPSGDVAIIVWEGIDEDQVPEMMMAAIISAPLSEHEAYLAKDV